MTVQATTTHPELDELFGLVTSRPPPRIAPAETIDRLRIVTSNFDETDHPDSPGAPAATISPQTTIDASTTPDATQRPSRAVSHNHASVASDAVIAPRPEVATSMDWKTLRPGEALGVA
ncbi:hypothetical protein [Streptomyces sp. V1I6]|uniref:hypothetical protein n=1 Tax=Streptomyces sp. V1I6 TaxID=3042273 RepID=UPI002786CDEC|nr:hypothetical protein [Streptomyces sp. V1I6]MDQ0840464.1 hypothetical protein [Streptomyces sp. V1I6]